MSKLKVGKKTINLIDESYNSNPLSLKTALKNFGNIKSSKVKKHLLLGDMLGAWSSFCESTLQTG